jgi:hypothetical protein
MDDDDMDQDQAWLLTSTAGNRWSQRRFAVAGGTLRPILLLIQVCFPLEIK